MRRFALGLRSGKRALNDGRQFLQVEWLGQIIEGAALCRRDRRQNRVLRAHHHDRKIGPHALDARDEIEAVFVGQNDIGDDEIALAGRNQRHSPAAVPVVRTS